VLEGEMKKLFTIFFLLISNLVFAQFNTGTITLNGAADEGAYITNGEWSVAWDDTYLYFVKTGGAADEPVIIYLDVDPIIPVSGGSNSDGTLTGVDSWNVTPSLPFRADARIYATNSYVEWRDDDGTGGWGVQQTTSGSIDVGNDSGSNREIRLSWSALAAISDRPTSFNWFGYASSTGGFVYSQKPASNYFGNSTTTPKFDFYYSVTSTENDVNIIEPFEQTSFEARSATSINQTITLYDLTTSAVVTVGDTYTVTIDGTVNLSNGISGDGDLNVNGSLQINSGGYTNISPTFGGSSTLIYANGGDYGQFNEWPSSNGPNSVTINSSQVRLQGNRTINGTLTFSGTGTLQLENGGLTLGNGATISDAGPTNFIITSGAHTLTRNSVGASDVLFPVGYDGSNYNPVVVNNAGTSDNISVRVKSTFTNAPNDASKVVNAAWDITEATPGGSDITLTLQWSQSQEAGSFNRNTGLHIGRYTGTEWVGQNASLLGSDPYTASASGFNSFSEFGVGSEGALPVELTSFTANVFDGKVKLSWETATEVDNYGFEVERQKLGDRSKESEARWNNIGFVEGHGNSNSPKVYSFVDDSPLSSVVKYRLKQIDIDGAYEYSDEIEVTLETIPAKFELAQNYPNPFNPSTVIKFNIPETNGMQNTHVKLEVFDVLGKRVAVIVNENLSSGSYEKTFNADGLSSGIYYYQLTTPEFSNVKKMILVR